MKVFGLAVAAACLSFSSLSFADADDKAWVNKCVNDNKGEGQDADVVKKYCTCMNGKMGDNETLSISAWEKTHKSEEEACSKEAGWKK